MTTKPQTPREDILANANLPMPLWELVGLVAMMMALNALAIDIMLPALDEISASYQLSNPNDQQNVVFAYMLGFGVPQLLYGPLSDARGRRNLLRVCLIGYILTAFACMATTTFELLLAARFLQGVVASGIRVVAVSVIRDLVAGRAMARIMSLILTIFMIVPILAPALGQAVIGVASWPWTFGVLGIAGIIVLIWVQFRLPETLPVQSRQDLSFRQAQSAFLTVMKTRVTAGYMIASGVIFGALFAFIGAAEQVFTDVFDEGDRFVLWFAVIASVLAVGNFSNSKLVERFGMRRISHGVLLAFIVISLVNLAVMTFIGEELVWFVPLFALSFGCFGMLGANFGALAMEPLGEIAGTASAVYGFSTTTVSLALGWMIARSFDGSVSPILIGFVGLGILSLVIVLITERGKLFELGH